MHSTSGSIQSEWIECSDWIHLMQTVAKSDPKDPVRITVDCSHGINRFLHPVTYPTPHADEIFNQVRDFWFFSKLDIASDYHHVLLSPESRPLTAFITPNHGILQYCQAPMGLGDAGAAFQTAVDRILVGLPGTFAYSDNILIGGVMRKEHASFKQEPENRNRNQTLCLLQTMLSDSSRKAQKILHELWENGSQIKRKEEVPHPEFRMRWLWQNWTLGNHMPWSEAKSLVQIKIEDVEISTINPCST